MTSKRLAAGFSRSLSMLLASIALLQFSVLGPLVTSVPADDDKKGPKTETKTEMKTEMKTETPIKHVIVIIGENRSFDHVFATYKPKDGESVWNLLSQGIVKDDGTPGPNFSKASQSAAMAQNKG